MGSFNSQPQGQTTEELLSYDEYIKQRPGNTKQSQMSIGGDANHANTQIIRRVIDITKDNEGSLKDYLRMLEQMRKVVDCDNLYLPAMYKIRENDHVCSTFPKLEVGHLSCRCFTSIMRLSSKRRLGAGGLRGTSSQKRKSGTYSFPSSRPAGNLKNLTWHQVPLRPR